MLTPILVEDEPDEDVETEVDTTTLYVYARLLALKPQTVVGRDQYDRSSH